MQTNRLTVIGGVRPVHKFQRSDWLPAVGGRFYDPLELSPGRYACQFETTASPLFALQNLSRRNPGLVFLLDYETGRTRGLAMVKAGILEDHCVVY
jgi:hypothetical protein